MGANSFLKELTPIIETKTRPVPVQDSLPDGALPIIQKKFDIQL